MILSQSKRLSALILSVALTLPNAALATVVEVQTVSGNFQVNLFDQTTPETVENFLSYVNAGGYANNVVHRTQPGFVMQAGGFSYNNAFPPSPIQTGAAVVNEPVLSNVRGTIAMAKVGGNPNSATSQWFINVNNNSANLDVQNGGFTVFGQVIGDGMDVVDAITNTPNFNFDEAFTTIPLRDFTSADQTAGTLPNDDNLVIITDVVVVDASPVTNPNLNPAPNTLIDAGGETGGSDSDSGGAMGAMLLSVLAMFTIRRRISPAKIH